MQKKVTMIVLRDYWDEEGNRVRAGSEVDMEAEAALDAVETGALARKKDKK